MLTEIGSFPDSKSERGAALMTALFIIVILTVLGTLVLNTSIVETKMAANQKASSQVFYAAEAGLERGLKVLVADMESDGTSGGPWANLNFPSSAGSVTAAYVSGSTVFDPNVRSMDMYLNGDSASGVRKLTFTNGGTSLGVSTYELYIYSPSNDNVYLMSYAKGPNGTAALEYHLDTEDNSPYNNAIFSGTGLNGKVNGNVNISGSVYSQGAMVFGGTAGITNNYTDGSINGALAAMLPGIADLNAKVRVKGADLKLTGNSHIGTANSNGSVADIQVDGTFTSNKSYYSDNVGSSVPNLAMPGIMDGLTAAFPGVSADPAYSGISNLNARAMAIYKDLIQGVNGFAAGATYASTVPSGTITSKGVVVPGNIEIKNSTPSFQYVDSLGNGISYNAASSVVTFIGMVYVDVGFKIDKSVTYVSKGAFVGDGLGNPVAPANQVQQAAAVITSGEVKIEGSFVPNSGGYLQGGSNTNSIGFVAGDEIGIEGSPGTSVTGMFYTPGGVEIEHQVQIAGTLIGGQFEFENVPDIYQVPALKNYLPQFMPGANTILTFKNREWRRVY